MPRFFFFKRINSSTKIGIYETRVESSDNDLTELKRGIEQILQKLLNVNQPGRNNNLNAGPKSYKIAKDTINIEVTQ
ncbi:hypothetical protein ALC53_14283 [Atta colombica]|uniref:Uncharacterized protein n=1 Tax=Atta colombica TaxID=520822 RepID=A0A151HY00_9HYME|nr:hypothetical protein ALC53_14283 [Atta colombica]